jgi:hypothetical protein
MNLPKEWITACVACGLGRKITVEGKKWDARYDGLTLQDLRRSAVRNLINAGVRERVVMQISRLQDTKLVQSLTVVSPVEKALTQYP